MTVAKVPQFNLGVSTTTGDDGFVTVPTKSISTKNQVYLPTWRKDEKYKPLDFSPHIDPGSRADPSFPNLFSEGSSVKTKNVTPKFGTEVFNVQLSELNDEGKDELALFVAQRGLAIFRNQDFASKGPGFITEYAKHFGPLHVHPTTGSPKGHPEIHVVYRPPGEKLYFENRNNLVFFHSDVSYELQPPGTTFFTVLESPESGGDTLFADTVEAYNRLSPEFQKRLEGLHVLHSSKEQADSSLNQGGFVKRAPVSNIHPLVRIHPVTGKKALYVNPQFSRKIVELKEEESNYLLKFLYDHVAQSHDLQARARWEPNTVVLWDNRVTSHSAIFDWETSEPRLAVRLTPQAERPIDKLGNLNKPDKNRVLEE